MQILQVARVRELFLCLVRPEPSPSDAPAEEIDVRGFWPFPIDSLTSQLVFSCGFSLSVLSPNWPCRVECFPNPLDLFDIFIW